ncbi:hypothetical protein FF1_024027 [Malus domestica]
MGPMDLILLTIPPRLTMRKRIEKLTDSWLWMTAGIGLGCCHGGWLQDRTTSHQDGLIVSTKDRSFSSVHFAAIESAFPRESKGLAHLVTRRSCC